MDEFSVSTIRVETIGRVDQSSDSKSNSSSETLTVKDLHTQREHSSTDTVNIHIELTSAIPKRAPSANGMADSSEITQTIPDHPAVSRIRVETAVKSATSDMIQRVYSDSEWMDV